MIPVTSQKGLASELSDHCPILLDNEESYEQKKIFRFEKSWFTDENFKTMVQTAWSTCTDQGSTAARMVPKHRKLRKGLKIWG